MSNELPSGAGFFYFHRENNKEIKGLWRGLAQRFGIEVGDKDTIDLIKESFNSHGFTNIKTIQRPDARLSISLYRNIVIVTGVFYRSVTKADFKELPGVDSAIGMARVIIGEESAVEAFEKEFGKGYTRVETESGLLCQFEEKEGEREHFYFLIPSKEIDGIEHFLTLDFPLFDFEIHKLHMERDYFKNQQKWIMNEKEEIDKSIGDLLHKSIVGETLNPRYIKTLEGDIDLLSSKYAILVNDGHLLRKARTTLEDDIEMVQGRLNEFGKIPSEGLEIIKGSIDLKDSLIEAEISISYAIKNTKTAIDTVRTSVELLRSRENIFLQEEAISFQVAAGILEFIIIFYYSLTSWLHILGEERFHYISPTTRFLIIFLFASSGVILTHFVGKSYKENWRLNKGMIITSAVMIAVFIYIVFLSIQTGTLYAAEILH
jgi:hypothetical protein